ncbi:sulfurtransferase TusA family protein [Spirochaetia bacterium 38H-sp]|uniref:Sulfurtransferase TusA family protein n=1 Tax=Rarispira pelagica TaxID=3141764 RepID=A0ABU9U9S6_9SPIR
MRKIDITREHCPMTFVKAKLELEKLSHGEELEILLTDGEPLDNVPRNAEQQGYIVVSKEQIEGSVYKVVIKRP